MRLQLLFMIVIICCVRLQYAARILAILPFRVDSHFAIFETLLKGLAARGHQITVISHYPQKTPVSNYTDLSILGSLPSTKDNVSFALLDEANRGLFAIFFLNFATASCKEVYKHPNVKHILNMKDKFDLVINEIWGSDCFLPIVYKYKIPHIGIISSVPHPWSNDRVSNPDNPSYIPNFFLPYNDRMSFTQRLVNFIFMVGSKWLHYFLSELPTHENARQYFGEDLPPLSEIARSTSLVLANSHFSLNYPRPTVPSFIEIAGLHIKEAKKLPEEILNYIEESEHGVIYFSFGTMVRPETMPQDKLVAFLEVFSELPQRVLWKCNATNMPVLPHNVRCHDWLPQRDILDHPNVRVFITHGGMMGTQEAVYTGVPMLGIPLFADQMMNIETYVSKKVAIKLDFPILTKKGLFHSLTLLLNDSRYRDNAQKLSAIFKDRPQSALETAIYWTEYVIRHGGAPHLRSAAMDLYWYQYLLIDVIAVLLIYVLILCGVTYIILKKISFICKNFVKKHMSSKSFCSKKTK